MILEFSFESSEYGVLTFFKSFSLLVEISEVIISELVNEKLCWVSIIWEKFVVSIKLVSHSSFLKWNKKNYTTVFDEFNWGLALEWDFEDVSEFKDEQLFSSWISVQILFADSGVVSVWLYHCIIKIKGYFWDMSDDRNDR